MSGLPALKTVEGSEELTFQILEGQFPLGWRGEEGTGATCGSYSTLALQGWIYI